jgi:hypothetical protein
MTREGKPVSDDDKIPEPHPLLLTRKWVEDYTRWVAEGCPTPEEAAARKAEAKATPTGPPDLQALVERAGRRYAASIGEEYVEEPLDEKGNVIRPPHQGGYPHITPEEWAEYDCAMAAWQAARRTRP